jgi:hypothetical protein
VVITAEVARAAAKLVWLEILNRTNQVDEIWARMNHFWPEFVGNTPRCKGSD